MRTCFECGGQLEEKTTDYKKTWQGKVYKIIDVPIMVCAPCGEGYYDGPVLLKIEEMLKLESSDKEEKILHFKVA